MLSPDTIAPDFTLPDEDGNLFHLNDHRGKNAVVLFFFPKADTWGCTAEACAFRDVHQEFKEAGAVVAGISRDSVSDQKKFGEKQHLPYRLLSDSTSAVHSLYDVGTAYGFLRERVTYVIDKEGIIRHAFSSSIRFDAHAHSALECLRRIQPVST